MPARAKKILIKNNRTFNTNFSQTFYKFLQQLGEEMAWGHSKSMFPVAFTCTQSLPQCTLILLSYHPFQKMFCDTYEFSNEKSVGENREKN